VSTGFDRYSDDQWAAIGAVRAHWPPGIDWAEIRSKLEILGRGFHGGREMRPQHPQRELRSLRKKVRLMKALEAEPDLPGHVTEVLKSWRVQLEAMEMDLELYASKAFRGRAQYFA
jgi:hypothetical protein